jgi:phospholipid N-methyltransferase
MPSAKIHHKPKQHPCRSFFERKLQRPEPAEPAQVEQAAGEDISAKAKQAQAMAAMRQTLAAGVTVVSAPQLFPTPPELARQVVELADIAHGMTMLEPSAGTGALLKAVREATGEQAICTAVELNGQLFRHLQTLEAGATILHADFMDLRAEARGHFDRIVMNPPFVNAQDIQHIEHAITFLKPGGKIVAICANGPRQSERLGALAEKMGGSFEALPVGSFLTSGTNVRVALFMSTVAHTESAMA